MRTRAGRISAGTIPGALLIAGLALTPEIRGADVGTAFTFQGVLRTSGAPAEDPHDMKFRLYDTDTGGQQVGPELVFDGSVNPRIDPATGLFTVKLDFGAGVFTGQALWLEMDVSPAGAGAYVTLSPRKEVTAAPYAVHALGGAHWQQSGTDIYYVAGEVGIGVDDPQAPLHVAGSIQSRGGTLPGMYVYNPLNDGANVNLSWLNNVARLRYGGNGDGSHEGFAIQKTGDATILRVLDNANLGVGGETAPLGKLHVQVNSLGLVTDALENDGIILEAGDASVGLYSTSQGSWGSALSLKEINGQGGIVDTWGIARRTTAATNPSALRFTYGASDNYAANQAMMTLETNGDIGIGTGNAAPGARLHVSGTVGKPVIRAQAASVDDVALEALGAITATGTITTDEGITASELVLTGGADIAEPFNIRDAAPQAGMVVVIDPANAGELRLSTEPYDRKVVGVVSGAGDVKPGLRLGQKGSIADGEHPVALTGRVYVWCDASAGSIAPGDLLTTSTTPGHAMKAADHDRAQGAVLGKAMTGLREGKGLVLVLVTLQ
ncbi:MAG: hypothetical protein FLDDKLPJ_03586 [Phycisphaerae bacterium]|nr:hypothetical protein [Phycisphaerae bacterium]